MAISRRRSTGCAKRVSPPRRRNPGGSPRKGSSGSRRAAVPAAALDRERAVLREQAQANAKTEAIVEKMVEGRLRKFYEEVVLLEQVFVVDGERRVGKVIEAAAKEAGAPIRIAGFVYFKLGEGVDR